MVGKRNRRSAYDLAAPVRAGSRKPKPEENEDDTGDEAGDDGVREDGARQSGEMSSSCTPRAVGQAAALPTSGSDARKATFKIARSISVTVVSSFGRSWAIPGSSTSLLCAKRHASACFASVSPPR